MSAKNEEKKLYLELTSGVDDPAVPVSTLVRKAVRLATAVADPEFKLLFEMHLSGHSAAKSLVGLEGWPAGPVPRWNVQEAFVNDRSSTADDGVLAHPLQEIESLLALAKKAVALGGGGRTTAQEWANQLKGQTQVESVIGSIRNRVAVFLTHVQPVLVGEAVPAPDRVFIGHGGSSQWKVLRDHLGSLNVSWDEFNRETPAGLPTTERLTGMLDHALFAFLVMTAEDEHVDGSKHARENVIHEVGLFQGKLGFRKAIVLLEEACQEFTNITGLGQIRFRAGRIEEALPNVERVLAREGILP